MVEQPEVTYGTRYEHCWSSRSAGRMGRTMCCRFWRMCCAAAMCRASGCSKWPSTTTISAAAARSTSRIAQLIAALERSWPSMVRSCPIYWGNRNWHPLLADTLRQMAADGVRRALAFVTSALQLLLRLPAVSREHCRGAGRGRRRPRPQVDKLRVFFNHPGFIEPMIERTHAPRSSKSRRATRRTRLLIFTAHSIPLAMAEDCRYEEQLREACRLGGRRAIARSRSDLASGLPKPQRPAAAAVARAGHRRLHRVKRHAGIADTQDVVVVPIGFISDHMEVLYDLDTEVRQLCERLGINMVRAATVGTHPRFVRMIRELIEERMTDSPQRLALGTLGPSHDVCPDDCCLYDPEPPHVAIKE